MTATRAASPRRDLARAEAWARGAALWVREGVATEGLERRIVWIVVGVALVLGPVAFTLARSPGFTARIQLLPQDVSRYEAVHDPAYYRQLMRDPFLVLQMRRRAGAQPHEYDDATIVRGPRALVLGVESPSPERAQVLANALGPELLAATARHLIAVRDKTLREVEATLDLRPRPPREERLRLYRLRRDLYGIGATQPERAILGPPATKPPLATWADRLADRLPGEFPGRPSPFWVGLSGLLLFAALWVGAYLLVPPRGRAAAPALRPRHRASPIRTTPLQVGGPVPALGLSVWLWVVWVVALVATPVVTLVLIAEHGVNVPFWDDWALVALFEASDEGRLSLGDLLAQHNEHRPVIARTADFVMAPLIDWDLRVELYRNFAVVVATFVLVLLALRRTLDRIGFLVAAVLASLLVFSPVQWENWLWGWQLTWFLSNLGAVLAFFALAFMVERSPRRGLVVAAAGGVLATFSLGQGLLVWPIGLALLLLARRAWRAWAVVSVVVTAAYFVDWENPAHMGSKTAFLERPVDFVEFVFLYLGRTLGNGDATGKLIGLVMVASFLAAAAYVIWHRHDRVLLTRASIWLAIGLYALGAGIITAVSRVAEGVIAYSRYNSMGVLFALSTMALLFVVARSERVWTLSLTAQRRRLAVAAVALPLLLAGIVNGRAGADAMRERSEALQRFADCTRTARSRDLPCLRDPTVASPYGRQWEQILYLRHKGWAGYR